MWFSDLMIQPNLPKAFKTTSRNVLFSLLYIYVGLLCMLGGRGNETADLLAKVGNYDSSFFNLI